MPANRNVFYQVYDAAQKFVQHYRKENAFDSQVQGKDEKAGSADYENRAENLGAEHPFCVAASTDPASYDNVSRL